MHLIHFDEQGDLPDSVPMSEFLREVGKVTGSHYARISFVPPWLGYVGIENGTPVAVGGFKSQPVNGRIEIAYGTVPDLEGNGYATSMARELIRITRDQDAALTITAQTLPEANASGRILTKLGFKMTGTVEHPEDGLVWDWELAPSGVGGSGRTS